MGSKYLIVMGTFRTGSTFRAKALSAHKNITVPSDCYFYFFKALRNEIFCREGYPDFDKKSPVSDNFYSEFSEINSKIRDYDLNIPIKYNSLEEILKGIAELAWRDSPKLVPLLKGVKAETYEELFRELIKLVEVAYGDEKIIYSGFKVTFCEQFLEVLLNTYPDLKCIYLVRDPRAITASQNVYYENPENVSIRTKNRGRYPTLYVIRHWRKSFAYLLDNIDKKKNIFILRYEDTVAEPEKHFRKICNFLELDYDSDMCDPSKYKDGEGNQWTQNSSFGTSATISTKFFNKWEQVLSEKELQLIEDLCSPEMELLGYKRKTRDNIISSVFDAPNEDINKIDPWIRPYLESCGYIFNKKEAEKELLRKLLMNIEGEDGKSKSKFFDKVYVGKNYLEKLRTTKFDY